MSISLCGHYLVIIVHHGSHFLIIVKLLKKHKGPCRTYPNMFLVKRTFISDQFPFGLLFMRIHQDSIKAMLPLKSTSADHGLKSDFPQKSLIFV